MVTARRSIERQISKAMCMFQPPSATRKSLCCGLGQKLLLRMSPDITETRGRTALKQRTLRHNQPQKLFLGQHLVPSLGLADGQAGPEQPLWLPRSTDGTRLGRSAPLSGDSSVTEGAGAFPGPRAERLPQLYPTGTRVQHPCLPAGRGGKRG